MNLHLVSTLFSFALCLAAAIAYSEESIPVIFPPFFANQMLKYPAQHPMSKILFFSIGKSINRNTSWVFFL